MKTSQAVILAAGIGKRLDIFETPKPLVKLRGESLVIWTIERLREAGIKKIYIVIRPEDKLIRKELIDYNNDIEFIERKSGREGMLGSILSIDKAVKGPFFITACDLLFDKNPFTLFFKQDIKDTISVLVSTNKMHNLFSEAQEKVFYQDKKILYVKNKKDSNALEAGVYHFTQKSYSEFTKIAKENKDIAEVSHVFNIYREKKVLTPVLMKDNEWFDINTPVTLIRAELFLQKKLSPSKKLKPIEAKYKKLKAVSTFDYKKKITFDVDVIRRVVKKIGEYEVIPHEFYYSPHHILIDKDIYKLYGEKIYKQFVSLGYRINKILVDSSGNYKSMESFSKLADEIITAGIDKKSIIISLGGGVVKDIAGFLASTLYRGIGFISIPTTLLSQCDAAIALKQGVDGPQGKNLLGSYYAPIKIIVDPSVLLTLNDRYISDGLAECFKQSFAQDKRFYNFFKNYNGKVKNLDFLEEVVTRAIKLKISSIEKDYHEENFALVNQYGHEIGHAIEYLSGYKLLHGESVAIGMRVSAELSHIMGIAEQEVVDAHIELLGKFNLPFNVPANIKIEDIIHSLRFSKKFHGNKARFVLVDKIGSIWHDKKYYFVICDDKIIMEAIKKSYGYKK